MSKKRKPNPVILPMVQAAPWADADKIAAVLRSALASMDAAAKQQLSECEPLFFPADVAQLIECMTPLPVDAGPRVKDAITNLREAIKAGFLLAVARYMRELENNCEAMAILDARRNGGAKGRESQTQARLERAARARAMLAKGDDVPSIAAALNCTPSTVYRLLSPANGKPAKPRRRSRKP